MTKPTAEQITDWAKKAEFPPHIRAAGTGRELDRFASLAYAAGQAAEREACGKTRAGKPRQLQPCGTGAFLSDQQYGFDKGWREGAASVRAAIRARNKEEKR